MPILRYLICVGLALYALMLGAAALVVPPEPRPAAWTSLPLLIEKMRAQEEKSKTQFYIAQKEPRMTIFRTAAHRAAVHGDYSPIANAPLAASARIPGETASRPGNITIKAYSPHAKKWARVTLPDDAELKAPRRARSKARAQSRGYTQAPSRGKASARAAYAKYFAL